MRNSHQCPYRDNNSCTHKDRKLNSNGRKRSCGFKNCPESCSMYLDWVDMVDMEYLEKESLRMDDMASGGYLG